MIKLEQYNWKIIEVQENLFEITKLSAIVDGWATGREFTNNILSKYLGEERKPIFHCL